MKRFFAVVSTLCLTAFCAHADQEYDNCVAQAYDDDAIALCMKANTARLMKKIQEDYIFLSEDPISKEWNKGNGLKSGNLRDMYNSWLAYRNRYCSLYMAANVNGYGSDNYHREACILEMTKDHEELLMEAMMSTQSEHD